MDKDRNQHGLQNIWNMEIILPHIITTFAWVLESKFKER